MRKFLICLCLVLAAAKAFSDTAKVSALVVDERTRTPMPDVQVVGYFTIDIGWRAWAESVDPNKDTANTGTNGLCRLSGDTNCGHVGCRVANPPPGYYAPWQGWGHHYTKKNLFGVWQPDNLVATIVLQRVEHPIPLFVKKVELNVHKDLSEVNGGHFSYDLVKGDWLPPLGRGEHADIDFARQPREDLGQGTSGGGIVGPSFRDTITVKFPGPDNGLAVVDTPVADRLRIRHAPESGYVPDYLVWTECGKDLQWKNSTDPNRCLAFRIRSRRDDDGKLVEAFYGKIYGDFETWDDIGKIVDGVAFFYYLNPTPLDRNLEFDCKNNLNKSMRKQDLQYLKP